MRALVFALCLFALPAPLWAQDAAEIEADKSAIATFIQDQMSDAGRKVEITGFAGSLSARATMDSLTVADDNGVWLELTGITLDWSKSALLTGRIDISEFSAQEINVIRPPITADSTMPTPEAVPFSLPELPVSIQIAKLRADRVTVGAGFLGTPVIASVDGSADLIGGAGSMTFVAQRLDGAEGRFDIAASYANETGTLDLDIALQEGQGGIIAGLAGIPGQPALDFAMVGVGPIDAYQAEILLASDGEDRLAGTLTIAADTAPGTDATQASPRRLVLDVGGDVTALFLTEYRDFFGPQVTVRTSVLLRADGGFDLENLELRARALRLEGSADIGPEGWPNALQLTGDMADPAGGPVLLPLGGAPMQVESADIKVDYDAAKGDRWDAVVQATGVSRSGIEMGILQLAGGGTILTGEGDAQGAFTAALVYLADSLTIDDPALDRAIGDRVSGQVQLGRVEDGPLSVDRLTLRGPGLELDGSGQIEGPDGRFAVTADLRVNAADLSRFDQLTGLALGGRGNLKIAGRYAPFDGFIEGRVDGTTLGLSTGIAKADPLLAGAGLIGMKVDRDEAGLRLTNIGLNTAAARLTGDFNLSSGASVGSVAGRIHDVGLILPGLTGPLDLTATANRSVEGAGAVTANLQLGPDQIDLEATQDQLAADLPAAITVTANLTDLSRWQPLTGQALDGRAIGQISGTARPDAQAFDLAIQAAASALRTGSETLDKLIAGDVTFDVQAVRPDTGGITLRDIRFVAPNLSAEGTLTGTDAGAEATYTARIADMGLFAEDFSGPLTAEGTARREGTGDWQINTAATGPGGTAADIRGSIASGGQVDLGLTGQAPLGLFNTLVAPRRLAGSARFDLRLSGPPGLDALSGRIDTAGAAVSAPTLGQSLDDITGQVTLANGRADLDLTGRPTRGGRVQISGPVGLAAPFTADLTARVTDMVLRDPELYSTTLSGRVIIEGPLQGGALIRGRLDLGETEIQVPSTDLSTLGELAEVDHQGAPAEVRQTLSRAGLTLQTRDAAAEAASGAAVPYALDITVGAPSRIFVRGRGLDAELGGNLTLGGTTADIQPRGQFTLVRGRLDILQQRFTLTEGTASLQGDFEPYLRFIATTTAATGTIITISIEGPASEPEITFSSAPELPQDEVLAELIFGRDLRTITPLQAVQLAAAIRTLAGKGGPGFLENFRNTINLDDFDVITDEDGNAAVRAGKYLTENLYADVTVGAGDTSEINLNLDVTENLTARGTVGTGGETSLGLFFETDY